MENKIQKLYWLEKIKSKFEREFGYALNLKNPQTLSEKIQWLKLYGNLESYSKYVDKYEVRQFVKERIGEKYLIPNIGVYNSVDDIDMKLLPKSFVMKATHASGSKYNCIVSDKSNIDWNKEKKRFRKLLNRNYYERSGQPNYKNIKGRIIIEELLQDPSGDLMDYKFFCFHGKPKYVVVIGEGVSKADIYDMKWKKIPVKYKLENFSNTIKKPKRLNELIKVAKKLSSGFPFVRVDLYYTNDRIYFGELTFTSNNGYLPFTPANFDKTLGQLLDLSNVNRK